MSLIIQRAKKFLSHILTYLAKAFQLILNNEIAIWLDLRFQTFEAAETSIRYFYN